MKYTKEDLMNTWGVVESKEHAEYIAGLAELHGFHMLQASSANKRFFQIGVEWFALLVGEPTHKGKCKKITIPLPPKEWKTPHPPCPPYPPKYFDCVCVKCGGKCCAGFCGEQPKVGEEVLLKCGTGEMSGKLLALTKEYAIVSQGDGEQHLYLSEWRLEKPKSKQELLIEELHQKLLANNCGDEYLLACDIVQGKIEGLSYE